MKEKRLEGKSKLPREHRNSVLTIGEGNTEIDYFKHLKKPI